MRLRDLILIEAALPENVARARAVEDAEAYMAAKRSQLTPQLTIRCPRRWHKIAEVYSTRWGPYLWCAPGTMTPRDLAGRLPDDQGTTRTSWPKFSGLRETDNIEGRGACGCSTWEIPSEEVRRSLASRKKELVLAEAHVWRTDQPR